MNLFKAGDRIIYFQEEWTEFADRKVQDTWIGDTGTVIDIVKMPEQISNYVYIVQLDNETMIKNAEKRRHKITSGCAKTMRLRDEKKT